MWVLAIWLARWLRYDFEPHRFITWGTVIVGVGAALLHLMFGFLIGPYGIGHLRASFEEILDLTKAVLATMVVILVPTCIASPILVPRSVPVTGAALALMTMFSMRLAVVRRFGRGGTSWFAAAPPETRYVIGIGSGSVRRAVDERLTAGFAAAVLVHPTATVGADVRLGRGTVVCAGARLTTNIETGRHVHVNLGSTVGHDCGLGAYVTVNPLVAVSGSVTLGDEVMMGTHSAILQGLTMGARSVAGAGRASSRTCRPTPWSRACPPADSLPSSSSVRARRRHGLVRTTSCWVARVIAT